MLRPGVVCTVVVCAAAWGKLGHDNNLSLENATAPSIETAVPQCTFDTQDLSAGGTFDAVDRRYTPPAGTCVFERRITPELARKCMANRSLAFVGDSNMRDFGAAVARFLSGEVPRTAATERMDKYGPGWGVPDSSHAEGSFPDADSPAEWSWRVNVSMLPHVESWSAIRDIVLARGKHAEAPLDLAFVELGCHMTWCVAFDHDLLLFNP